VFSFENNLCPVLRAGRISLQEFPKRNVRFSAPKHRLTALDFNVGLMRKNGVCFCQNFLDDFSFEPFINSPVDSD
jgi:hypothetical protein